MSGTPIAIDARGLEKTYGSGTTEVRALQDVDLTVRRGELVALLGPSGAGKSTLLMALGLLEPLDRGRLEIDGEAVAEGSRHLVDARAFRRDRLGFVFQRSNLIPFLSAGENVALPMQLSGVTHGQVLNRTRELLESLGVVEQADHLPSALSGGQQQRIAVARALANRPAVLLADEPTAALDSVRGRQVMELFRDVSRRFETAVLVVTHDHRSLEVFDRILEMEDGRLGAGRDPRMREGTTPLDRQEVPGP